MSVRTFAAEPRQCAPTNRPARARTESMIPMPRTDTRQKRGGTRLGCAWAGLLLGLLLSGGAGWALGPHVVPISADITRGRWVENDDTPWLRAIRRYPLAHARSVAYWLTRARAFPPNSLDYLVLLKRAAEAQEAHDLPAAYLLHLAVRRQAFRLPYAQARAEALLSLVDYHVLLAHYDSAAHYLPAAEQQFRLDRNLGGAVRCLLRIGRIADQQGHYAASVSATQQAWALSDGSGSIRLFHTSAAIQLATTYTEVGAYAEARRYLLDALRVAIRYDYPDRLNLALGMLGEVCRHQRQWADARAYYTRSLAVSHRIDDEPYALAVQLNLVRLREAQRELPAAAHEGRRVLARLQAVPLPLLVPLAQALLARVALRQGQVAAAVAYGHQSLAGSQRARLLGSEAEAQAVLADAYTAQRHFGAALIALRGYAAAHDSLLGDVARRRTAVLQQGQRQRNQQLEIERLTQQNRLQAQGLELERLRTQRERAGLGALVLGAAALASGLLWRYRHRQQQRDETLRQHLAADLHDDVGSLLTQISLQSDLLREAPAAPEAILERLNRLSDNSRRAARQMADVVWGLHYSSAELPEVLTHMRDHAHEVMEPTGLAIDFSVTPTAAACRPSFMVCQNLYLIYKEALHNVVKHARGASQVTIRLSLEDSQLCLRVHDNGAGPAATLRPGGHGLANMRLRAEAVGGSLHYVVGATGFAVVACLPRWARAGQERTKMGGALAFSGQYWPRLKAWHKS